MKRTIFRILLALISTSLLMFNAKVKAIPETIISVEPSATVTFEGNTFSVNVTVKDVSDLFAFEFCLGYNTTVLDVLAIIVLPPFNPGPIQIIINDTEGYVRASGMLPPGAPGLSGSFPLVTITFKATCPGISTLHLYDTTLLDPELNELPHILTDGTALVLILGDVNGDGKVDIKDLVLLIKAYGSYPDHPQWNPNADINSDSKVDIKDLVLLIKKYGKYSP